MKRERESESERERGRRERKRPGTVIFHGREEENKSCHLLPSLQSEYSSVIIKPFFPLRDNLACTATVSGHICRKRPSLLMDRGNGH